MDSKQIPVPRENDVLLSALFVAGDQPQDMLRSLKRCRICWNALFLSDLTSANGQQIERRFLSPLDRIGGRLSSFKFGQERQSAADWAAWAEIWGRYTLHGLCLVSPLGN